MIRDFLSADDWSEDVVETGIFLPRPPAQKPEECKCDLSCVDNLPVGSMYAPMQVFRNLYSPDAALDNGTLFCELNLPFLGGHRR